MAKLSVYVPDELWGRARVAVPDNNPSQIVQKALAEMVGQEDILTTAEATAEPLAGDNPRIEALRNPLDDAALAGGVAALEDHDDLELLMLHPVL